MRASTASCNILFSLRRITSGARISSNAFRRLFLVITLLYKSLKSAVAKRPPSKGTKGLKVGGKTGNASKIISSGRLPLLMKASTIFNLLISFCLRKADSSNLSRVLRSSASFFRLIRLSNSRIASPPIRARKLSATLSLIS